MEENNNFQKFTVNNEFVQQLTDALIHILYRLVYLLFILPYGLWKSAVIRLSKQKKESALDVTGIQSEFPFLSWCKRFTFDFLIDGLTTLAWPLFLIYELSENMLRGGFWPVMIGLYIIYWAPGTLAIIRDLLTIFVVMPIRWFLSFLRRPAKTFDLTHVGTIKKD